MRQFFEQQFDRLYSLRRRLATGVVAMAVVALAAHVLLGANGVFVYNHKRNEIKQLQQENEALERENQRIADSVKALKSDPKAIEKEAREQLKYARPGEVVYTLPANSGAAANTASNRAAVQSNTLPPQSGNQPR